MNVIRKIRIKWQVWCGKAVDIWSKSPYPANVLSNLHDNEFYFDGVKCGSMEGFLQSLKQKNVKKQYLSTYQKCVLFCAKHRLFYGLRFLNKFKNFIKSM